MPPREQITRCPNVCRMSGRRVTEILVRTMKLPQQRTTIVNTRDSMCGWLIIKQKTDE